MGRRGYFYTSVSRRFSSTSFKTRFVCLSLPILPFSNACFQKWINGFLCGAKWQNRKNVQPFSRRPTRRQVMSTLDFVRIWHYKCEKHGSGTFHFRLLHFRLCSAPVRHSDHDLHQVSRSIAALRKVSLCIIAPHIFFSILNRFFAETASRGTPASSTSLSPWALGRYASSRFPFLSFLPPSHLVSSTCWK